MAELADALDLGSSAARRAGSSPVPGTKSKGRDATAPHPSTTFQPNADRVASSDRKLASQHKVDVAKSLHLLHSLIDGDTSDYQNHQSGRSSQPFHQGSNFVHLSHNLDLFLLHMRLRLAQEQLIVLLHGECTAVDEEDDQDSGENSPNS